MRLLSEWGTGSCSTTCWDGVETRSRTCSFDGSKNTEALIDERSCPTKTCCSGDEKLWYGESELATYSSDAGNWSGAYPVSNMFDNNKNTIWHSDALTRTKTITVDFKVLIHVF